MIHVLAVMFILLVWLLMAEIYAWVHGARLRWWAVPAAHGALLFRTRLHRWEA